MIFSTASTTTIASSTTMPIASTRPNSVSMLIEKPISSMPGHGADDRHGNRQQRDDRRAHAAEEQVDHDQHQHERLDEGVEHQFDRRVDEAPWCRRSPPLDLGGNVAVSSSIFASSRLRQCQRVGARAQVDAHAARGLAVQARLRTRSRRRRVRRGPRRARAPPNRRQRADHDVAELLDLGEPAGGLHRERQRLAVVGRRLCRSRRPGSSGSARGPRCPTSVDVRRYLAEPIRVEPQAHRVGRANSVTSPAPGRRFNS